MASGDTKTNQYLDIAANGTREDLPTDTCCETRSQTLIREVAERIIDLEEEVQELEDNPDVADIVDTYADLMAYDTSRLTDRDIIRVLNDETHNGESTYYRYNKATDSWTYIGSTGPHGGAQSDWDENDSTDPAYIKNKPFYSESVESDFEQEPTTTSGSTPDTDYVWFIEQFQDYALHEVLADFDDGDTVYATITYSVNGVERSDIGKFTLTFEGSQANLDYDAPAGSRWYGAYISEVNLGDTTVRWPVLATDSGATVYITNIEYGRVKQIDAEYIPIDNDTIRVNADGELQATSSGATYIAGDGIDITNAIISATNTGKAKVLTTNDYNYPIGNPTRVALWLLDGGTYTWGSSVTVAASATHTDITYYGYNSAIVSSTNAMYDRKTILALSVTGKAFLYATAPSGTFTSGGEFVTSPWIANNLTTVLSGYILDARQGKVLKDLIDSLVIKNAGAPTTATVGTVGMLLEDTTNGDLYICTAVSGSTYTWEEVGAGGGSGVTTLTSADYDYPDNNPTEIAAWRLNPGIYETSGQDVKVRWSTSVSATLVDKSSFEIIKNGYSGVSFIIYGNESPAPTVYATDNAGNPAANSITTGSRAALLADIFSGNDRKKIEISNSSRNTGNYTVGIGYNIGSTNTYSVNVGYQAQGNANYTVSLGASSKANAIGSVAIGARSLAENVGEMNIGSSVTTYGYNNSNYRLLTGLYDGQSNHDAATVAQGNKLMTAAPTTTDAGVLGQLWTDTTAMHTYQLTAIDDTTDPDNPAYTWTQRW